MDVGELGDFLRSRRTRIRPFEVGLKPGVRRRVSGLRRDEVARLAGISLDYYIQLEQGRGGRPSDHSLARLARALRLSAGERAELFRLVGRAAPIGGGLAHVQPALLSLLDRLGDAPALVITDLHEVLVQNPLSVALIGDQTWARGVKESFIYRWFTEPATRAIYPAEDHPYHSRVLVTDLRAAVARGADDRHAADLAASLCQRSLEFTALWGQDQGPAGQADRTRFLHPSFGLIDLDCASLYTADLRQRLLWFTAPPGSAAAAQLAMLAVIGLQELRPGH